MRVMGFRSQVPDGSRQTVHIILYAMWGRGRRFQQYEAGAARNIRLTLLGPEGPTDFQMHSARTSIFSEPIDIVD